MQGDVGALWDFRVDAPQGLGIAVAQFCAQVFPGDERRVADDVVGGGPDGRGGVYRAGERGLGGFVRDALAGDGVKLHGAAVPASDGKAGAVADEVLAVVGQQGVGVLDIMEVAQDRFDEGGGAGGAEVPLQVADPEHEFGDGDGARVLFEAEELVRVDGYAGQRQALAFAR